MAKGTEAHVPSLSAAVELTQVFQQEGQRPLLFVGLDEAQIRRIMDQLSREFGPSFGVSSDVRLGGDFPRDSVFGDETLPKP